MKDLVALHVSFRSTMGSRHQPTNKNQKNRLGHFIRHGAGTAGSNQYEEGALGALAGVDG
jgi:hypothetical protein